MDDYIDGDPNFGVYSSFNINLYAYTWQNPVKYFDPDGNIKNEVDPSPGALKDHYLKLYHDCGYINQTFFNPIQEAISTRLVKIEALRRELRYAVKDPIKRHILKLRLEHEIKHVKALNEAHIEIYGKPANLGWMSAALDHRTFARPIGGRKWKPQSTRKYEKTTKRHGVRTNHYRDTGGWDKANKVFNKKTKGKNVEVYNNGDLKICNDGDTRIILRKRSKDGAPTIEVDHFKSGKLSRKEKTRYDD